MSAGTPEPPAPDPPARRRWGRYVVAALITVALLVPVAARAGLLRPIVTVSAGPYGTEPERGERNVVLVLNVRNRAPVPVRITGAGERVNGLDLERVELTDAHGRTTTGQVTAGPGSRVRLTLHYRVYDCDLVPDDAPAIPVSTTTPLGIPGLVRGVDRLGTGESGDPAPWTVALTRPVCRPG